MLRPPARPPTKYHHDAYDGNGLDSRTNGSENLDAPSHDSDSDLEYGPGIVERLKAKFHRLSGSENRHYAVHSPPRGIRSRSMEDFAMVTRSKDSHRSFGLGGKVSAPPPSLTEERAHFKSGAQDDDGQCSLTLHRTLKTSEMDEYETTSVSALRRKFDSHLLREGRQSKATPSRDRLSKTTLNNNDVVLPMMKAGRLSSNAIGHQNELSYSSVKAERLPSTQNGAYSTEIRKAAFIYRTSEMPTVSSNARVIDDDFFEDRKAEPESSEIMSPPDPDSARQSTNFMSAATVFVRTDHLSSTNDSSPPPEEPKPSLDRMVLESDDHILNRNISSGGIQPSSLPQLSSPQIISYNNDSSGVAEMRTLLSKFQRSRDERQFEKQTDASQSDVALPSNLPSSAHQRSFVHAIVGVRPSCSSPDSRVHIHGFSMVPRSPNILNITVRKDDIGRKNRDDHSSTLFSPTAADHFAPTASARWWPSHHSEQSKNHLLMKHVDNKPIDSDDRGREELHARNTGELNEDATSPSQDDHLLRLEESECSNWTGFEDTMVAGDGNFVHHSLLSLAMEEDIPALLEAMHETFTCEFEDFHAESPSCSSILAPNNVKKAQKRAREVSSIRFEEASPKVYTYLDELSAMVKKEWEEGVQIDYETYQRIVAAEAEDYRSMLTGLHTWQEKTATKSEIDSLEEFDVDMPSSSFGNHSQHTEETTLCT